MGFIWGCMRGKVRGEISGGISGEMVAVVGEMAVTYMVIYG